MAIAESDLIDAGEIADKSSSVDSTWLLWVGSGTDLGGISIEKLSDVASPLIGFHTPEMHGAAATYSAVVDDRTYVNAAITAAATVGGVVLLRRKYRLESNFAVLLSNVTIMGQGVLTGFVMGDGDVSGLQGTSKTNITLKNFSIECASAGTTAYVGGVMLDSCTECVVEGLVVSGQSWGGIVLWDSSYNVVRHCKVSAGLGTLADSAGILLYNRSEHNTVLGNHLTGCGWHGILLQDPYSSSPVLLPAYNRIVGNHIDDCDTYGIAVYIPGVGTTENQIIDNHVSDIDGATLSGAAGAGIYVVGPGIGGTVVRGNNVKDCCQSTSTTTLVPACIAISGVPAGESVIVEGNIVVATKYDGIRVSGATSGGQIIICNNKVNHVSGNTTGIGIYCIGFNGTVANNTVYMEGTTGGERPIFIQDTTGDTKLAQIIGNSVLNNGGTGIELYGYLSGYMTGAVVANNSIQSTRSGSDGLYLTYVDAPVIKGNHLNVKDYVFWASNVTNAVIASNVMFSDQVTDAISSGGTCTGMVWAGDNVTNKTPALSGSGEVYELAPLASQPSTTASTATDVAGIVSDFNDLRTDLITAGVIT